MTDEYQRDIVQIPGTPSTEGSRGAGNCKLIDSLNFWGKE